MNSMENYWLHENIDYSAIKGLKLEARQKLAKINPATMGRQ